MKILIVGGAGYVGGITTDVLLQAGHDITVYDILAYEERYLKPVKFIYGDIRDREKLYSVLSKFDFVVWLAAVVGDAACATDPYLTQAINEDAVKWFVDHYDGFIVYPSTCSVYGINSELIDEEAVTNPLSVYAKTKLAAERYILEKAADRSLIFRLGTLFGLGDTYSRIRLDLVVNVLAMKAARGQKLTVFGGSQWRPLIHVLDVARAIEAGIVGQIKGLYNLAAFNCIIHEIAEEIKNVVPNCEIEKVEMTFEDQRNYRVKIERWQDLCLPIPEYIKLSEGIQEIVNLVREDRIKNLGSPTYSNTAYIENIYRRWL